MPDVDLQALLARLAGWWSTPFVSFGEVEFSVAMLTKVAVAVAFVIVAGRLIRRTLSDRLLPRLNVEPGTAYSIANILFYAFVTLGVLVVAQSTGINITSLTVLLGALGVGLGFGLQEIASNFISGVIILLERPIKIGDRIQVGDLDGEVVRINMRATEILTNDSIAVIVPNKDFITLQVINWSRGGDSIRVHVPIGVAYGSDPAEVREALFEASAAVGAVLQHPAPAVRLVGYGDSSIDFELLAWTREFLHTRAELVSRLNFAIHEVFRCRDIQIPFPQRDLHVQSPVEVALVGEAGRRA